MALIIRVGHLPNHEIWPLVLEYGEPEGYAYDNRHRWRFELKKKPILIEHRLKLLAAEMPCVNCGAIIHPAKNRKGYTGHMYLHVTCDQKVNLACSRSRAASKEMAAIRKMVEIHEAAQKKD
jgi:hypothetical protein